ncbi:hypothetical protein, partial [Acinetobacter baumannii]|uniref:hypothetical protein n=1 Tax=Acinetobacter baumannii TaxID=470 RepID=UPI0022792CE1
SCPGLPPNWLVEKFGPRRLIAIGTVMAGMSWVLSAQVNGLATLWLVYGCMGGLGQPASD